MSSSERRNGDKPPREPISITDKRRVDPETGRVRGHTPSEPVTPTPQRNPTRPRRTPRCTLVTGPIEPRAKTLIE